MKALRFFFGRFLSFSDSSPHFNFVQGRRESGFCNTYHMFLLLHFCAGQWEMNVGWRWPKRLFVWYPIPVDVL
ncbi:hypothetical protein [Geobacillus sp. YF-1]|uniref:hypothetical protein n=1 Tax=Geobacillus sp. YF-1 TaxID=3457480 RepID=UPI00404624DC